MHRERLRAQLRHAPKLAGRLLRDLPHLRLVEVVAVLERDEHGDHGSPPVRSDGAASRRFSRMPHRLTRLDVVGPRNHPERGACLAIQCAAALPRRPARDFARLPSMGSRPASCQNPAYWSSPSQARRPGHRRTRGCRAQSSIFKYSYPPPCRSSIENPSSSLPGARYTASASTLAKLSMGMVAISRPNVSRVQYSDSGTSHRSARVWSLLLPPSTRKIIVTMM